MSCIRGEIGFYISDTRTRLLQVIPAVAMILHLSVLHIQKESTYRIIYVQVCVCIIGQQWHANTNRLGLSDTHTHTHSLTHTHNFLRLILRSLRRQNMLALRPTALQSHTQHEPYMNTTCTTHASDNTQ